jgi:FAD synthetase
VVNVGKRIKVLVGGVFDLLHVGHVHFLTEAKKMGDELIVIVAHDETVKRLKGRPPVNSMEDRAELLRALKPVDKVYIGAPAEISYELVKEIDPDVIVLGPDQNFDINEMKERLREHGINAEVMKIPFLYRSDIAKTSKIIERIIEHFCG